MSRRLSCTGQPSPPCQLVHCVLASAPHFGGGGDTDAPAIDGAFTLGRNRARLVGGSAHFEQEGKWSPQCAAEGRGRVYNDDVIYPAQQGLCGVRRIWHALAIARFFIRTKINPHLPASRAVVAGGASGTLERIER